MITRNRTIALTAATAVLGTAAVAPESLARQTKVTSGRTSLTRNATKALRAQEQREAALGHPDLTQPEGRRGAEPGRRGHAVRARHPFGDIGVTLPGG